MTQNEKKVLMKFNEVKQANTVKMAGTLRVTINYACDVCNKLCEKGYLERLSPGRFALYKITSLGEEQVGPVTNISEGKAVTAEDAEKSRERREIFADSADNSAASAVAEEYECTNCGATIKEEDIVCPQCGAMFEEFEEEEEKSEMNEDVSQFVPPAQRPVRHSPKGDGGSFSDGGSLGEVGSSIKSTDSRDKKPGILDHPSVPKEWKSCNWEWK